MMYDREYVLEFLKRFVAPIRPELQDTLLETFDALVSGKSISQKTLIALVDAATDRRANVYQISAEFLGEIAERDDEALGMIKNMAISEHAHIRHNALLCLSPGIDPQVSAQIIREGLKDKSSGVRIKAADWAHRLQLRDVVPDLAQALKTESHAETLNVMRDTLKVLKGRMVL